MNTGIFGEGFPYSNFHDLNMDWIIKIAKDFLDQYTHIQEIIEQGKTDIQDLTDSGLEQLQEKANALEALLQDWYNTHSEDIANQLADALNDLNAWYTQHENYLNQTLADNILAFNNAADEKARETIESIPADYTTLSNTVNDLKSAVYSKNLFNKETAIANKERNTVNGDADIDNPGVSVTDWIPMIPGKTFYFSVNGEAYTPYFIYVWNTDDVYQGRFNGSPTYSDIHDQTSKISICYNSSIVDGLQIEYDEITDYMPYGALPKPTYLLAKDADDLKSAVYSNNLFNKETAIANKERNPVDGNADIDSPGASVTDWIPMIPGKTFYFSVNGEAYTPYFIYVWNTDDVYQGRFNGSPTYSDIHNQTSKISICFNSNMVDRLQIEYDEITDYMPYGALPKPTYLLAKDANDAIFGKLPTNPLKYIKETPGYASTFLTVGCIGDSLCSGCSSYWPDNTYTNLSYADFYQHSWGQYMARMTGNTYHNFSQGGLTTRSWLASEYATQCYDGNHNCTAYIIGLGQNDYVNEIPLGTISDIKENYNENPDTYYGNYGKIIQKIKAMFTGIKPKIFVITDPLQAVETAGYNDAVRAIANKFDNVWLIDMYTYGRNIIEGEPYATWKRNAHYNANAYYFFACMIQTYIDWIIRKHFDWFCCTELIGTGYYMYSTEAR